MNPKKRTILFVVFIATVLLVMTLLIPLAVDELQGDPIDTFSNETEPPLPTDGLGVVVRTGLTVDNYADRETVKAWLDECADPMRDDMGLYVLRYTENVGDSMRVSFLIYRSEKIAESTSGLPMVTASQGESRATVSVVFTTTEGIPKEGYELTFITLTLPSRDAPRLKIYYDGESVGSLTTVSDTPF